MRLFKNARFFLGAGAILLFCLPAPQLLAASKSNQDPVEELRLSLKGLPRNRKETLQKLVKEIHTIGELRRALSLSEWKLEHPTLGVIDLAVRADLGNTFRKKLQMALKKGNATTKVAVANLVGEIGTSIAALQLQDRRGFARSLAADLLAMLKDENSRVRESAARALGKINADPKVVVESLAKMLTDDGRVQKQAAVESLGNLIQTVAQLEKKGRTPGGVEATWKDVVDVAIPVVKAASAGLKDADAEIRRLSVEVIRQSANAMTGIIPLPLSDEDRRETGRDAELFKERLKAFQPLIKALGQQGAALAKLLFDPSPQVRRTSLHTLEEIALVRRRLRRRQSSMESTDIKVHLKKARVGQLIRVALADKDDADDPLLDGLKPVLELIQKHGLAVGDEKVRLAAIDFLELLAEASAPAGPALVKALEDESHFVRWAAARTLGKIGAQVPKSAVPALARLLSDDDLDVRLAAAVTLEGYGSGAAPAVAELTKATTNGDPEIRIAAMKALVGIGKDAEPAIPSLITALGNEDDRVRQAAAETLGGFGKAAVKAVDALRKASDDEDTEVRRAAAEALLNILSDE